MKFTTITLGCKVNLYETESLTSYLENKGWEYSENNADVCIINTCTVTSTSDQKSRQMIRQAKRNNPNVHEWILKVHTVEYYSARSTK